MNWKGAMHGNGMRQSFPVFSSLEELLSSLNNWGQSKNLSIRQAMPVFC